MKLSTTSLGPCFRLATQQARQNIFLSMRPFANANANAVAALASSSTSSPSHSNHMHCSFSTTAAMDPQLHSPNEKVVRERLVEREKSIGRQYYWIAPEAESLIAKAYARHEVLAAANVASQDVDCQGVLKAFPPSLAVEDLEAVGKPEHFKAESVGDKIAFNIIKVLEKVMSLFFREKYDHHAVTLETVAAVPGIVAAANRHFRSLRSMKRDHGWINPLQEEAENERMHLLIWMQHTQPTRLERYFVMFAQLCYVSFYTGLYAVSPKIAHRATGYLEEAAHRAYTEYLHAIDNGQIKNVPALKIAKKYYRLKDDATLRDVVLHVRADECMHRDYNHHLANLYKDKRQDQYPKQMH